MTNLSAVPRVLILDRNPDDPRWLLATVQPGDVHAAVVHQDGSVDLTEGHAWARERVGRDVALEQVPPRSLAWHVREGEGGGS